jgi:Ca2+-binding EF-hand superfamily protein
MKESNYNRRELYTIFLRFKALCALSPSPAGITKTMFKQGIARLAVEDDMFVDRVYDVVDEERKGRIGWKAFLQAMNALEKGTGADKAAFFFKVYDTDGSKFISRTNLEEMFKHSSMLFTDPEGKKHLAEFAKNKGQSKLQGKRMIRLRCPRGPLAHLPQKQQ